MTEPTAPTPEIPDAPPPAVGTAPPAPAAKGAWERIKEHKVLQWSLAYLGAALALAHGQELLSQTYHWPELVARLLMGVLIVGFPIALAIAWYHGHKGLRQIGTGELTVISILIVIGAGLLTVLVRAPTESAMQPRAPLASAAPETTPALSAAGTPAQESAPAAPAASIAVVPFVNLTGDTGKEYFSDGMAEELINLLAQVPGLKVPARTSSFAYKGHNVDIRRIAQDLGVATIVEGSVRSAGERIRVTAQLVNAQTGYHVWSRTYDRSFGDVFKLEDEISAEIVKALRSTFDAQLPAVSAQAAPTSDPEAYRLYMQARSAASTSYDVALRLATQATLRDPSFARAWAYKAIAGALAAVVGAVSANTIADAEHDANQALALDPNLPEAQTALGIINVSRGNWLEAETSFRRAVELAPGDSTSHSYRAIMLWSSAGHVRQGLKEIEEAYALAPAATGTISSLAAMYSLRAQNGEALKYADLAAELGGSSTNLIAVTRQQVAVRTGHCGEAVEEILPTLPAAMRSPAASLTVRQVFAAFCAPADWGTASRALTTILRNVRPDALGVRPRSEIIVWYAMLGDLDGAFDFANRSLDEYARHGTIGLNFPVLWLPEMRSFRKDPRFQSFVTRLNLIGYWKQYGPPDDCDLKDGKLMCH
jgi:TolB-like protein